MTTRRSRDGDDHRDHARSELYDDRLVEELMLRRRDSNLLFETPAQVGVDGGNQGFLDWLQGRADFAECND